MSDLLRKLKLTDNYGPTGLGMASMFIIAPIAAFALVVALMAPIAYQSCQNRAEIVGMEYEWDFFSGCYYPYEGVMVPDDVWLNNQSDTTLELNGG